MPKEINLSEVDCLEIATMFGKIAIPCGKPAAEIVWHNRDGKAYPMCAMCAHHNIENRGGIRLVAEPEQVRN